MIEQVAFLSEQAVAGAKDRKPGVIKATLGAVSQAAGSISAVAGAWQAAEPYGMTVAQIAEVCGVAAGEIERILQQA